MNDWNVECEGLPSQTDLIFSNKGPFMISRMRLIVLLAACFSCSVLDEEFLDFKIPGDNGSPLNKLRRVPGGSTHL
jgi:hypothetical protein